MESSNKSKRNFLFFVISVSPFLALVALLTWGQFRTDDSLGMAQSHSEFNDMPSEYKLAPTFAGNDIYTGKAIDFDESQAKATMVTFWSSWCASCKSEAAQIAKLYKDYEGQPVEFIGISIWDESGSAYRYIENFAIQYPNILDSRGRAAVAFGVRGVPEKFFIDSNGRVVHQINGPTTPSKIRNVIDSLLQP